MPLKSFRNGEPIFDFDLELDTLWEGSVKSAQPIRIFKCHAATLAWPFGLASLEQDISPTSGEAIVRQLQRRPSIYLQGERSLTQ
jgi:hypothetical protein